MSANLGSHKPVTVFVVLTVLFAVVYSLNNALTGFLLLVPGAHLVHIPSGLKLMLVLVCGWSAVLAIGVVSFVAGALFFFKGQHLLSLELALANALAPWLTRRFFVDHLALEGSLANLNSRRLIQMGLLYAALNSCMTQWLLHYHGASPSLLDGLLVMFIGDVTGVLLVMAGFRALSRRFLRLKTPL